MLYSPGFLPGLWHGFHGTVGSHVHPMGSMGSVLQLGQKCGIVQIDKYLKRKCSKESLSKLGFFITEESCFLNARFS